MILVVLQSIGIDMSSEKFDVCFKEQDINGKQIIKGTRSFENTSTGFKAYLVWCSKRRKQCKLIHLMEATGVYHEELCYYLYESGEDISVELPQKIKYFIKSLNLKTKTDKADAKAIAQMGLSCQVELWQPLSKGFKRIRDMSRTLSKLKRGRCAILCQLHALRRAHDTFEESLRIMEELESTYQKLIAENEASILELVAQDDELKQRIARITTIKGVRTLTVVKLLAETDGFRRCSSIRRLVSYAGLDVVQNQSGKSIGKSRLSKKGNAYIREALYMPALCAARHNKSLKVFYDRLAQRMPKKKQAVVAVMRKLLITIYSVWKSGQEYDENYQWK